MMQLPRDVARTEEASVLAGSRVLAFLSRLSKPGVLGLSLGSMLLLGVVDFWTGYDVSFALFYLVPVALAAWYIGRRTGLVVSFASAATWLLANRLAGLAFALPLIAYWNAGIRLGFFIITTILLSELRRALDHQRALARTDSLTHALNGRAFGEVGLYEILRARRHGRPLTLIYLDLDNFKTVNDQFGHSTGDVVLQTVVSVIKGMLRATDTVARLGGDEFAVMLPETDSGAAQAIGARISERIADEMRRNQWPITCSVGIVTCREPPEAVDVLVRLADDLMYSAKHQGKNTMRHREYGALPDHPSPPAGMAVPQPLTLDPREGSSRPQ